MLALCGGKRLLFEYRDRLLVDGLGAEVPAVVDRGDRDVGQPRSRYRRLDRQDAVVVVDRFPGSAPRGAGPSRARGRGALPGGLVIGGPAWPPAVVPGAAPRLSGAGLVWNARTPASPATVAVATTPARFIPIVLSSLAWFFLSWARSWRQKANASVWRRSFGAPSRRAAATISLVKPSGPQM